MRNWKENQVKPYFKFSFADQKGGGGINYRIKGNPRNPLKIAKKDSGKFKMLRLLMTDHVFHCYATEK